MKTQTAPKVKLSAGRGRPKKVMQINRRLSLNTNDFKQAVAMMMQGKSLTKIEKATSLNLKSLRAVRRYAIDNNLVQRKEGHSIANRMRAAKKATVTVETNEVKPYVPDLFDLIPNSNILTPVSKVVEDKPTPALSNRTLTIDFKGILMQVEITSIEVKDDIIVVR